MEKFDTLVALVFSRLFSEFPEPVRLSPDPFLDDVINKDDEEGSFNFMEYFWHTTDWLVAEGYVRITLDCSSMSGKSYEVVLTQKGLQVLRKVPDSLGGNKSLGERLVEFSKNKGSEAVGTLVSLVINTANSAVGS